MPRSINGIANEEYTEEHIHNRERWYGKRNPQTATQWSDGATLLPYRCISGNNTWGPDANDEAQLFGTADTPIFAGGRRLDFHRILILANNSNSVYRLRIIWGTGTIGDAIAAGDWSSFMFVRDSTSTQRKIMDMMSPKIFAATKIWMQCWNVTDDATIDFFIGVHEYDF